MRSSLVISIHPWLFFLSPLTTILSVISLLSAAARPSFLSLFYTACKRTSIFVLLSVPSSCSSPSPLLFLHLINLLPGDVWVQRLYLSCNQSRTAALIEVRDIPWICRIQRSISFPPIATIKRPRSVLGYSNQHEVALRWKLLSSAMERPVKGKRLKLFLHMSWGRMRVKV